MMNTIDHDSIGIGLVGYGYWGPNLARNFSTQAGCRLVSICDLDTNRRRVASTSYPWVDITGNYDEMLNREDIHAVVVATPVRHHYALAKAALMSGKDVLVEKPFTQTTAQARELIDLATTHGRIIAVDHTFLFTGAVQKIKELVDDNELGDLFYFDSVRINLGLFQEDVNVVWDLAPHDLSILMHLLDGDPVSVRAMGARHGKTSLESLAYLHVEYENGFVAHFHFSWLAPVKIRKTIIAGSRKMIVYDDLNQTEKVKVYDKGISVNPAPESVNKIKVEYRTGDVLSPKLVHREALNAEAEHFVHCVRTRSKPLADGLAGLRVVSVLEAAERSINAGGDRVLLEKP